MPLMIWVQQTWLMHWKSTILFQTWFSNVSVNSLQFAVEITLGPPENNIGDDGACALSEALKTNTMIFHIGFTCKPPSRFVHEKWFTCIQQTRLGIKELPRLVKWWKQTLGYRFFIFVVFLKQSKSRVHCFNKTCFWLWTENNVGDAGTKVLCDALKTNSEIISISVGNNGLCSLVWVFSCFFFSQRVEIQLGRKVRKNSNPC